MGYAQAVAQMMREHQARVVVFSRAALAHYKKGRIAVEGREMNKISRLSATED